MDPVIPMKFTQPKARVWNDNSAIYKEDFRGDLITIPPKGHVIMDWTDAVAFKGQYTPILRDGLGRDLSPKMIRLEKIEATAQEFPVPKFRCQMDQKEFDTQEGLDAHIAENHTEDMADDEARKKFKLKK